VEQDYLNIIIGMESSDPEFFFTKIHRVKYGRETKKKSKAKGDSRPDYLQWRNILAAQISHKYVIHGPGFQNYDKGN